MKRSAPMKRTPMQRAQPIGEQRPERIKPVAVPLARPPVYWHPANEPVHAVPKSEPQRNRALLDLARGAPCLLRIPRVCNDDRETTVAAHSNLGQHGKAGARKADDQYTVWACARCHTWLDSSYSATAEEKAAAFSEAHSRQVVAWTLMRKDAARPAHDRAAAQWAVERVSMPHVAISI